MHTLPGVALLTVQSFIQIRYFNFKDATSLKNVDPIEVSNIKHELKMWERTERSISTISKFDDISRSVIHSRVVLLNEALQREMESSHRLSNEHIEPRNLSFYLSEKNLLESKSDAGTDNADDLHEQLTRRLEELVNCSFLKMSVQLIQLQ